MPKEVRKEAADRRHHRSRCTPADRGRARQLVARDPPGGLGGRANGQAQAESE